MREIKIDTEFIKLGQLLKMSGIAASGSYAKIYISEGLVSVNDEVDLRRGRKCYPGDIVRYEDQVLKVI